MSIDFDSIEEAWNEADEVEEIRVGDHFITRETSMLYRVGVADTNEENLDGSVRRLKRAEVLISPEAFGVIAAYANDPGYGRFMFQRAFWDENLWISDEGSECFLDELVNIRVIMDDGEFL